MMLLILKMQAGNGPILIAIATSGIQAASRAARPDSADHIIWNQVAIGLMP